MRSIARLTKPRLVALALMVPLVAVAGCKSSHDKAQASPAATTQQSEGKVQLVEGGIVLTTDAGIVALGANTKIPDDFPKTVPVYPGAIVNLAGRSAGAQGKPAWTLSLETGDEQAKVVAFYASGLAASAAAFKKNSDLNLGDTQMSVWQSAPYDVTLMITAGAENQTTITMTVSGK
jgi:hypothetical protein